MRGSAWIVCAIGLLLLAGGSVATAEDTGVNVSAVVPAQAPADITGLTFAPSPFDPTAGSAAVSFTLSADATVTVVFTGTAGELVAFVGPELRTAGSSTLLWNGTNTFGEMVEPSWYTCTVVAANDVGSDAESCPAIVSWGKPLALRSPKAEPRRIGPFGEMTVLSVKLNRDAYVATDIRDSSNAVVRSWPAVLCTDSRFSVVWDGTDGAGTPVPAGKYYFGFTGQDSGGNADTAGGTISVSSK